MRKILVLFLFMIMGLPCFAYSTTTQMIMTNNIMMMSVAARNSQYKKHQSGYERCMKYKGGNACKAKYRVTKLHEVR